MSDYQDDFKRILDEELGDYAGKALALLSTSIQAQGLVLTQQLLQSLRADVVRASIQHVASMGVLFEQYGRIRDMKGTSRTKAPPIEAIEAYVRKVGLGKFQVIPGYTSRSKVSPTSAQAINRIAWGIARSMKQRNESARSRPWFAKTFYKSINGLIDAVTTRYAAQTGQHIAASIRL